MMCCVFFTNSAKSPLFLLHLVNRKTSLRGTVGSASACQARGHGFEPEMKRYIFYSGKYTGA